MRSSSGSSTTSIALRARGTVLNIPIYEPDGGGANASRRVAAASPRRRAPLADESQPEREAPPAVVEARDDAASADEASGRPATYVVQSGDTLSEISSRFYGTSGRWMAIFEANTDVLGNPDVLVPGVEIRLP